MPYLLEYCSKKELESLANCGNCLHPFFFFSNKVLLQVKGEVNLTGKGHEEQMANENLSNSLRLEMMFNYIVCSFFLITILTRKTGLRLCH